MTDVYFKHYHETFFFSYFCLALSVSVKSVQTEGVGFITGHNQKGMAQSSYDNDLTA